MLKVMVFYHLQENLVRNMVKKKMDTATKTGMDAAKLLQKERFKKLQKLQEI